MEKANLEELQPFSTAVTAGDCVVIPPGTPHKLFNDGTEPLIRTTDLVGGARCCAPAYSHYDTVMTGG